MAPLLLVLFALANLTSAVTTIDLSKEWTQDIAAIQSSPGAHEVNKTASFNRKIRTALVVESGKIVASYVSGDVDPNEVTEVYSVTKSWVSLIIGMLVDEGKIALETTLGDIFGYDSDVWGGVRDADNRKTITIEEMLTMTSGLQTPFIFKVYSSLTDTLDDPRRGKRGTFSYLAFGDIMSYVIKEVSGLTPGQFLDRNILPILGIEKNDITWRRNLDFIEWGSAGLSLTAKQMAKFGQLYLQRGYTKENTNTTLVSEEWLDACWTVSSDDVNSANGYTTDYGYLWYRVEDLLSWCAFGLGGQDICVSPELDRVVVQQRDGQLDNGYAIVASVAMDRSLSFQAADVSGTEVSNLFDHSSASSKNSKSLLSVAAVMILWCLRY